MNDREHWIQYFYNLVLIHAPHTGSIFGDFLKNEIDFNDVELHKYKEHAWESYNALRRDGYLLKEDLNHDSLTPKGVQESLRLRAKTKPNRKHNPIIIITSWLFQHKSEIGIVVISGLILAWFSKMLGLI